jgi:hypothetical protein
MLAKSTMPQALAVASHRLQASGIRTRAAYARLRDKIDALEEEMDEVTSPHGIPKTDLSSEDSLVIAVDRVIASATKR